MNQRSQMENGPLFGSLLHGVACAVAVILAALAMPLFFPAMLDLPWGIWTWHWRLALASAALVGALLCLLQALRIRRLECSLGSARRTFMTLLPASSSTPIAADDAELISRIGEKLSAQIANLENERDGLRAILGSMSEGILVVDSRRRLLFANPSSRKILGIPASAPLDMSVHQVTHDSELLANIEQSIVALQACSFEFQIPVAGSQYKTAIQAYCAPCRLEKHGPSGAVAVLHDITDLRRLERMRTEFVANVSHELRTPLTSLLGYLETLETEGFENKQQTREFLAICHKHAENLSRIVEDLLRLSKLENPQSDIAAAQVSLNEVVHAAVEQCAGLAAKRGIDLRRETPDVDVRVDGDRGLLVQAVGNLIENAINYNRDNGWVSTRLVPVRPGGSARTNSGGNDDVTDDTEWEIAVSDTGIGIPAHALQRVYERFYRVDKARSRSQGGTGLGLAIVKHIALAHGASVHVESEVGKGSTFFVRFKSAKSQSGRMLQAAEA